MKKKITWILIVGLVLVLFVSSVSAISKTEFKNFLKQEIRNYFNNEDTLLTTNELRKAVNFYFTSSGGEIDLSQGDLSQTSLNVIEGVGELIERTEEFSCTVTATGVESYEVESGGIEKEGYSVLCCDDFLNIWRMRACKWGHKEYTECFEINKKVLVMTDLVIIKPWMSIEEGTEICGEKLGSQWAAMGERIGFSDFGGANIDKCRYKETTISTETAQRTESKTIQFTLEAGARRKNLGAAVKISPEHGGRIINVKYSINCDSGISGRVSNGVVYVEK